VGATSSRSDDRPGRTGSGRRRLAPDRRQAELIEAVLGLAAEHDVDRLSVAVIARAANVSEGLLYHYFPTKRALVLAVVNHAADSLIADLKAVADPNRGGHMAQLVAGLDAYLDHVERQPTSWRALLQAGTDPEIAAVRARVDNTSLALVADALKPAELTPLLTLALRGWLEFERGACSAWLKDRIVGREQLADVLMGAFVGGLQAVAHTDSRLALLLDPR
jgi:AcrR family transcriptional regulator